VFSTSNSTLIPEVIPGFLFAPHANQSGSLQESCAASPEGRQYEAKGVAGNGKV